MSNRNVTGALALAVGIAIGWFAAPAGHSSRHDARAAQPTGVAPGSRAKSVRENLTRAGTVVDAEQRALEVRTALAGAAAADMQALATFIEEFAARRPDMLLREEFLRRVQGRLAGEPCDSAVCHAINMALDLMPREEV